MLQKTCGAFNINSARLGCSSSSYFLLWVSSVQLLTELQDLGLFSEINVMDVVRVALLAAVSLLETNIVTVKRNMAHLVEDTRHF